MLKLQADPKVLAALSAAFPKPKAAASKALEKYLKALGQQFELALLYGRTPEQIKLGLYAVSLHHMMQKGGHIGPQRMRLHKWLKDNNLELIKTVTKGSNLTGKLSEVALTQLLSFVEVREATTKTQVDARLTSHAGADNEELIRRICPELINGIHENDFNEIFDTVDIDLQSLANYIYWLGKEADLLSKAKLEHALEQAKFISSIAQALDGKFIQRKMASEFGRRYYRGTSVQNVHRSLRNAMLGNCWEYDIRSSVICWKMGYAKRLLKECSINETVEESFKFTLYYINRKKDMTDDLCSRVFLTETRVTKDLQVKLIKEAFTAISFGARTMEAGWKDDTGQWNNTALVEIIRNADERKRFLSDYTVKRFVAEQTVLDRFIFKDAMRHLPHLTTIKSLQTVSGKPSKSKVLAYLYQHTETMVMDVVAEVAAKYGHFPIARVHDAIFFRKSLGENLQDRITGAMRDASGNDYWSLKAERISRFEKSKSYHETLERAHRIHIQEEELRAETRRKQLKAVSLS